MAPLVLAVIFIGLVLRYGLLPMLGVVTVGGVLLAATQSDTVRYYVFLLPFVAVLGVAFFGMAIELFGDIRWLLFPRKVRHGVVYPPKVSLPMDTIDRASATDL